MEEAEKWEALMASIRKAARILNRDLTERHIPDYLNWPAARQMSQRLWAEVADRRKVPTKVSRFSPAIDLKTQRSLESHMRIEQARWRDHLGEPFVNPGNPGESMSSNPGSSPLRDMRLKLVQLKTDIDELAPELEEMHRDALESSVAHARDCNLSKSLFALILSSTLEEILDQRLRREMVVEARTDVIHKVEEIQELAVAAIIAELENNCNCKLQKENQ